MNLPVETDKIIEIQKLSSENDVARSFFEWAASRQKDATETNVERAADVVEVQRWEMVDVFKKLSELGLGNFITGRRGHKTRIRWHYSLRSIGKAAASETSKLENINFQEVEALEDEPDEQIYSAREPEMLDHAFKLRPDLTLQIRLPRDFNGREAERLAAWVQALPFE